MVLNLLSFTEKEERLAVVATLLCTVLSLHILLKPSMENSEWQSRERWSHKILDHKVGSIFFLSFSNNSLNFFLSWTQEFSSLYVDVVVHLSRTKRSVSQMCTYQFVYLPRSYIQRNENSTGKMLTIQLCNAILLQYNLISPWYLFIEEY